MSYLLFLILFIGTPLSLLAIYARKNPHPDKHYIYKGILVLCGLAFIYTTPWDNYLLAKKVWWYGPDRVLFTIGYVPIEEYTFFLVQTIMSGLWTFFILTRSKAPQAAPKDQQSLKLVKVFVSIMLFVIWGYGIFALTQDRSFYIGLILSWAIPVVILQFVIGGQHILKNWKLFLVCCLTPTFYLWLADAYAIHDGIWTISEKFILGYGIGILPIEEMVFFLITNIMVVQGLLLFLIMRDTVNKVLRRG